MIYLKFNGYFFKRDPNVFETRYYSYHHTYVCMHDILFIFIIHDPMSHRT